jgi:hypothetical protein
MVGGGWPQRNQRGLCNLSAGSIAGAVGTMRVLIIALIVVGLIGFASMVAFVLR